MKLSERQIYFRNMFSVFLVWAISQDYDFSIGEVFRPGKLKYRCPCCRKDFEFSLQDVYIYMKRSKARHSKHQDKLAFDIFLYKNGEFLAAKGAYHPLSEFWKKLDRRNRWGGDFEGLNDPFHFEFGG